MPRPDISKIVLAFVKSRAGAGKYMRGLSCEGVAGVPCLGVVVACKY